jgi:hypothetical protein
MDVLHLTGTLQHCSTGLDLTFCLGVVSMLGAELSMEPPGFRGLEVMAVARPHLLASTVLLLLGLGSSGWFVSFSVKDQIKMRHKIMKTL